MHEKKKDNCNVQDERVKLI